MYPISAENSAVRSVEKWNGRVLCEVERLRQICYTILLLLLQGSSIRKGVGFVCLFVLASVATVVPPGPQTAVGIYGH